MPGSSRSSWGRTTGLGPPSGKQHLDGIPVFEGLLIAHTNQGPGAGQRFKRVHPRSRPRGQPGHAQSGRFAGQSSRYSRPSHHPRGPGHRPDVAACRSFGVGSAAQSRPPGVSNSQAPGLKGPPPVQLVWLPLDAPTCASAGGDPLQAVPGARCSACCWMPKRAKRSCDQCLTSYLSDATYRVLYQRQPLRPFSPSYSAPTNGQPPLVGPQPGDLGCAGHNASPQRVD